MHRIRLVNYRGHALTPDTVAALQALAGRASADGWDLSLLGPEPQMDHDPMSMVRGGREIHLRLAHPENTDAQARLNATWGFAVPLGFVPWARYPVVGQGSGINVFHYFGPWSALMERLMAEGRGHLAWPSACCAAQVDAGQWKGDKPDERFVQAQLHRLGLNCGPIDGEIGPRTTACFEHLGLRRSSFAKVLAHVRAAEPPTAPKGASSTGQIVFPGRQVNVQAYGELATQQRQNGVAVTVKGPGRLVVDVGQTV